MNRVEFKTDSMNEGSRVALARIGAKEEETLRNHMVRPDGSLRHSTYFSVTVEEWPRVDERLVALKDPYVYEIDSQRHPHRHGVGSTSKM